MDVSQLRLPLESSSKPLDLGSNYQKRSPVRDGGPSRLSQKCTASAFEQYWGPCERSQRALMSHRAMPTHENRLAARITLHLSTGFIKNISLLNIFTPLSYQKFPRADISTSPRYQKNSPCIQIHTRFGPGTRMVIGFTRSECIPRFLYVLMNYLNLTRDARVRALAQGQVATP